MALTDPSDARDGVGLPPITGVRVVVNAQGPEEKNGARERVGALPHAVATINAFLDVGQAPYWTIPRACERNHLSLLPRLAARESAELNAHYLAYLFSKGLVHTVKNENLEMVQWLCCEYYPTGFAWKAMEEAAAVGSIAILEWLVTRCEYTQSHPELKDMTLTDLAAKNGHLETLEWIYKHLPNAGCSRYGTLDHVIQSNDLRVARSLLEHFPDCACGWSLSAAIRSGNAEMAGPYSMPASLAVLMHFCSTLPRVATSKWFNGFT